MARFVLSLLLAVAAIGQTPADLYALEEYRAWAAGQRAGPDLLDRYKAYLVERGADSVDAESTVRMIRGLAASPLVMEMAKGRKAGKALEVSRGAGMSAGWLRMQGWTVTEIDATKRNATPFGEGQWDLVIVPAPRGEEAAVAGSLRAGGILVIEGAGAPGVMPGLRALKTGAGFYCGERAK